MSTNKQYYNFNDGDYIDEDLSEIIQYMLDTDMSVEDIVGTTLDVCEEANVYSDSDYVKIQDVIYGQADLYCDEQFQKQRTLIMNTIEAMKYYDSVGKYIVTLEDVQKIIEE